MKYVLTASLALLLSACTVLPKPEPMPVVDARDVPYEHPTSSRYAQDIADQLLANSKVDVKAMTIGVTTLSGVTSDYNEGTPFAQTLTQQLMTEMHRNQMPLMDFKTTDFIRVTEDGDFALTRDYLEIDEILPITHVVVGTLAQHREGVMVSARLVNINNKDVVSVAQTFVPEVVVRQLTESPNKQLLRRAAP